MPSPIRASARIRNRIALATLAGGLVFGVSVAARAQAPGAARPDPAADLKAVAAIAACRPFLEESPDVQGDPGTIGQFFTAAIYKKLRGNQYLGYRYDEEGYAPASGQTVRLRLVRTLPTLRRYEEALYYALIAGAVRAGLTMDPKASAEVGVCLLGVNTHSRRGQVGILLEVYIENARTRKARFLRCAFGKPALNEALLTAGEFVMRMAVLK